jgi:starch phosphorylase
MVVEKKSGYTFLPVDVEGFDSLAELALDMRWSWNDSADEVWRALDPVLWELTNNPWVVLQTVSRDRLKEITADPTFREKVDALIQNKRREAESPAWFQRTQTGSPLTCVAYFSMEFMLSEALPIYSGGLGNVAGDQLKAASDLGVPVVGVGLLYQQGYFRQMIDKNGAQQALFPFNDPDQLPVMPVRGADGEWLRLEVRLPGYSLWLRVWQVRVGKVILYLLDSNDAANFPIHRGITSELYGGGMELRLTQEMLLGIGGMRLLRALGITPEVCHLNEGHAAFAVLERAYNFMEESGQPFAVALAVTRAGNLFTTHTPVAAGFDRFSPALIEQYMGWYAEMRLRIPLNDLLALGRLDRKDANEPFNMAYLAIRGSGAVNGVSLLHGKVSRRIFQSLFPRWPEDEVPVGHVTNGVHVPSWHSAEASSLWCETCGAAPWMDTTEMLEAKIRSVPDEKLWQFRASVRSSLVDFVRERLSRQRAVSGSPVLDIQEAKHIFDANVLTLGFARRFAAYKRPNLLLHDPERLLRILTDHRRPVQLIIAGKAHPNDMRGQEMIRQWTTFISRPEARRHVVFLSDYDMLLTKSLVQGVDLWLNTPRRPWEACGTSGMKLLANGGLNLSELDGWWAEAYNPNVGWALGDGMEHGDDPAWDEVEAEQLYAILEQEVIPEFYRRDKNGVAIGWVARMRESMARLTPRFSANRAVREYTCNFYIPAASAYLERSAGKGELGAQLVEWQTILQKKWANLRFGEITVETVGDSHNFHAQVYLNGIDPGYVRVELFASAIDDGNTLRLEMVRGAQLVGAENGYVYHVEAPASRAAGDYTPRIVPYNSAASVPLESAKILWQR